jgi:hypothetical protein
MRKSPLVALLVASMLPAAALAQDWPVTANPNYVNVAPKKDAAAPVEGLGRKGTLVITSDTQFLFEYLTTLPVGNVSSESHTRLALQPTLQFFVIDNLGLGAMGVFAYDGAPNAEATTIGGAPIVSYHIALKPQKLSLFPQVGLPYLIESQKNQASIYSLGVDVFAPFVLHLTPHFFAGLGPFFNVDIIRKQDGVSTDKLRSIGARFQLGGWL